MNKREYDDVATLTTLRGVQETMGKCLEALPEDGEEIGILRQAWLHVTVAIRHVEHRVNVED